MLIERFNWTFAEIDAIDPDDYTELIAYINASARIEEKHRPKPKRRTSN